jgi:hypothetical protein
LLKQHFRQAAPILGAGLQVAERLRIDKLGAHQFTEAIMRETPLRQRGDQSLAKPRNGLQPADRGREMRRGELHGNRNDREITMPASQFAKRGEASNRCGSSADGSA